MAKENYTDLHEHFEQFCEMLTKFGFTSAKYDFSLIKPCFLPTLVNERDNGPTVNKGTSQNDSFKFRELQLHGIKRNLDGDIGLDFFIKAFRAKKARVFS